MLYDKCNSNNRAFGKLKSLSYLL